MPRHEQRRAAVEELAASVRALADAAAETAVDPDEVHAIAKSIRELTLRLRRATDDTPYSGLVQPPADYSVPEAPMPLNPIIGACSPSRPDVRLRFDDGRVVGTARFTKRFVGPPGFCHGGISAMLADQIVAVSPMAAGIGGGITKALSVRYRRPLPLNEDIELWGECALDGDDISARYTITARGEVAVEGTGQLVGYERLARHANP